MPTRAKRPCKKPDCPHLTESGRFCAEHAQQASQERKTRDEDHDARRGSSSSRGYGHRWRKLRRMKLARDPVCETLDCGKLATEVDHIIRKRDGGTDSMDNLQSLCKGHHSKKTALERWHPSPIPLAFRPADWDEE